MAEQQVASSPLGNLTSPAFWRGVLGDSSQLMTLGVVSVLVMLIVPLPTFLLDFFMIINIIFSLVILITVINSRSALELSVFPTLLLFTTLVRLGINVSSTRLILSKGTEFNGQVVRAFADFVVGGSYVVGVIVFLIITAVMFMVITKGSTRVSEVSARFQLDAMPQKQMAIDTELNQGLIDEKQAMVKRDAIQQEANFYGNMDGASKFVSGDIKVGLLITFINILGGMVVGAAVHGESLASAAEIYLMLAIGDGLVSQIPSLVISVAAGIIVTKSVSKDGIGEEIKTQLLSDSRSLYIAGIFTLVLGVLPGFPKIVFFIAGSLLVYFGYYVSKVKKR